MQLINLVELTKQEDDYLRSLSLEKAVTFMHTIADNIGLLTVEEYKDVECISRRTAYDNVEKDKIKCTKLLDKIGVIINK